MKLKAPITAQIEMTNNCNYLCKHCYNFWRYEETGLKSFDEKGNNLDKILDEVIEAEIFQIVITGGEPLIKFNNVKNYLSKLKENNVDVGMNSNLSLLNSEKAKELQKLGLSHILTSLYSVDAKKNNFQMTNKKAFEKTLNGMKNAIDNGIRVSVNTVIDKNNFKEVYHIGKFLKEMGVYGFNASRFIPAIKSQLVNTLDRNEMVVFLDQLQELDDEGMLIGTLNPIVHCFENGKYNLLTKNRGCSAGLTSIGIGANGDVRACQQSDITYGNINNNSIKSIWANIPKWKNIYLPEDCVGCSQTDSCGGGCRQFATIYSDSIKGVDPLFTGPINIPQEDFTKDNYNGKYEFNDNLKIREEENGGVLYQNSNDYAVINKKEDYALVKELYNYTFSSKDIHEKTNISMSYLSGFFTFLNKRGILSKVGGK